MQPALRREPLNPLSNPLCGVPERAIKQPGSATTLGTFGSPPAPSGQTSVVVPQRLEPRLLLVGATIAARQMQKGLSTMEKDKFQLFQLFMGSGEK